jgi:hypothetical protein
MPWSTSTPVTVWTLILIVLGLVFWLRRPNSRVAILILWLDFLAINLIFFFIINWSITNYYLRFLCLIIPVVVLVRALFRMRGVPWMPRKGARGTQAAFLISLILLPLLSYANLRVLASTRYETKNPVPLLVLVPFYGMWVVTNGGNAAEGLGMSNYANAIFPPDNATDPSMAYAVDFQELTIRGNLSQNGSRPNDFRVYEGFNSEVFAPCQGTVVFVESGNPLKEVDAVAEGLGDRVVIQCFETYVTVANLRNIVVKENDAVRVGQTIGYLSNSGQPTIPHLHVHATINSYGPDGIPVPLLFEYVFATRNTIFIR